MLHYMMLKIIFSFRKLEDMMISRYFHIISDKETDFIKKLKILIITKVLSCHWF